MERNVKRKTDLIVKVNVQNSNSEESERTKKFAIQCRRPPLAQIMSSGRSNNISLKYQRFTQSDCKDIGIRQSDCKDIGIRKSEFVAKTQIF